MTDEGRDRAIAAIWKGIERIAAAIERLSDQRVTQAKNGETPPQAGEPEQPPLPGMPPEDWTPPAIVVKPRAWSNAVRFYDALWSRFHGEAFKLDALFAAPELAEATKGKIGVASYARVLSALVAAHAAERHGREYALVEPTDALREAVEAARKGGSA